MPRFTHLLPALFFFGFFQNLFSQNVVISYQNPDALYVCGTDTLRVTLQNTAANQVANLLVTVTLPAGITYTPGSVAGALESDISNLNAPKFSAADLSVGAALSISLHLKADCDLIDAINSGVQFANTISVSFAGGSQQLTTDFYAVETGLLFITDVNPLSQTGVTGSVLTRTISVRNTRQGPITALQFTDKHQGGISINLAGIGGQNSADLFVTTVPGSYFAGFGDGDNLFEYNEIITLTEEITLLDCGIPQTTDTSLIKVAWGCDGTVCQADSATAEVKTIPGGLNPNLIFVSVYGAPLSYCGNEPSVQELLIINTGNAPAESLKITIYSNDSTRLGLDVNSFELNAGTGWSPLPADYGQPTTLVSCGIGSFKRYVVVSLPDLAPGDTLRMRFDTYFCEYVCASDTVGLTGIFSYKKACPAGEVTSGNFTIRPDKSALEINSKIYFDIGVCLENDAVYEFDYWVESQQLLNFTGFLRLQLELPWGLFWENTCVPTLDGQTPLSVTIDSIPNLRTTLNLTFQLPMSQDSVYGDFCLRNICQPSNFYEPAIPSLPESGTDYTVYPTDSTCSPCIQNVRAVTFLTTSADADAECGISVCDDYELVLNCGCDDPSCIGGGGNGSLLVADFDSWRTNVGFRDNDNNRSADDLNPANSPLIRLDRFLPGDTMRTQLRGMVLTGTTPDISFRIFNESWQSDFGIDGGDAYEILSAKTEFTNADLLRYLDGSVTLKIAATGEEYTCPVGAASNISDQHYVKIAEPNIRPEIVYDELATMFHEFTISLPQLASTGCVPSGLLLQPGDSLIFTGDFKFSQNFTPEASSEPPLINFRNTVCGTQNVIAWQYNGCFPPLLRQYSGYLERVITPVYRIESCNESAELSPFQYSIRIARENLFPYEVRRLAALSDFQHSLIPGMLPLEARLNFLRLQENTPVFSNQLLQTGISGNTLSFGFQPFFSNPLDEGFSLETSLKFGPNCEFSGPGLTQTSVGIRYFSDGFHEPNPFTAMVDNPLGYMDGKPALELTPDDEDIILGGGQLELGLILYNDAPDSSPNTWLSWQATGDLSGVEIFLPPQQQPLPSTGGVFQLGELQPFTGAVMLLKGQLKACEPVLLTFRYGWDCAPVTNAGGSPCGYYERTITLRPVFPELELVVLTQPDDVPMCAPSDIFEFEVYNAADGVALDVLGSIKLPPGLSVVPNSSRLSYPAGNPFVNLADPVVLPGNVWQWTPENASAALASNGLQSIDKEPDNALRIRFRVQAACGFVANTRPVYGAEGLQLCGATSNILRKPGDLIQLEGFGPSYDVAANLAFANVQDGTDCGESSALTATIILDGSPNPGDSIYVVLPAGVSYVGGSYQPGQNAPGGPPQIAGNVLQLPFPANLPANATVQFNFAVTYNAAAGCADQAVTLQARERISVFCPLINQNCAAYIAAGEALLFLQAKNPDLILQNFETTLNNNALTFTGNLLNEGSGTATNPVVQFYLDQNGNGQVDAGEPLVTTLSPGSPVAPGASLPLAGGLDVPPSALCQLLAFIPASENCACADKTFPVNQNPVVHSVVGFCEVISVTLGVEGAAGSTYTWLTPDGLSCTNCAQTSFTPGPAIQPGDVVTLVLEEKTGTCSIEHRFEVRFGGELELQTPDQFICEGESVQLEATPGGTYQWSGPGLTNPNNAFQIVQPEQTSSYSVTITFSGGCTGTGQAKVTVFQKDSLGLGSIVTCPGKPVDVFGTPTDQPGFYSQNLQNINGCDSVVTLRLIVFPPETFEVRPICPGDSTVVFDSVFTEAGNLCRSFTSGAGCDSTHCVTVELLPEPVLPAVQDSFVISAGEEAQLQGPADFSSYTWTPAAGLSCTGCPDPLASPDTSTVYLLTVADPNGCSAAVTYRVLLCDFDKLNIPNAFTPNGDGVNDVFRIVPVENLAEVRSLTVYNRWGQKVWEGTGLDAKWDGTIGGEPAASDVYVWLLRGGCGGEAREKKGDVGLLR